MELGANTLIDAITQMQANQPNAKVILTSVAAAQGAAKVAAEMRQYQATEYHEIQTFMGMKLLSDPEIETDHAFFFATVEDANEFLESIRELKDAGMDWHDIVRWFEYQMRRLWK